MTGKKVSADLNDVLNHLVGDLPAETEQTKSSLTDEQRAASYSQCTWYNGCYYCKNAIGDWVLQYCIA